MTNPIIMKTADDISVYLVDDDKMFLKSMEHQLQQKLKPNIAIKSFQTAEQCLMGFDKTPKIVVLDYLLNAKYPDAMNGIQALEKIKKADPDAIVIMLSAQDKMNIAVETIKHGAYDYIIKNENTYLRIQNILRHAITSLALTKKLRWHKQVARITFLVVTTFLIATLILLLKNSH